MTKISTCLWFEAEGHLAADFYVSLIDNSRIIEHYHHRQGPPLVTEFELAGVPYTALNGGASYQLDAAASISVTLETQDEIDWLWNELVDDGEPGTSGWLRDRYGMAWQIIPKRWHEIRQSTNKTGMRRAFRAMTEMEKIDIKALEQAFFAGS